MLYRTGAVSRCMVARNVQDEVFNDQASQIGRQDVVRVAVADGHTVAAGDGGSLDHVSFCFRYGRGREGSHVEKDNDFWPGAELPHKLCEDDGYHVADFIEEDADAVDFRYGHAAKALCELGLSGGRGSQ